MEPLRLAWWSPVPMKRHELVELSSQIHAAMQLRQAVDEMSLAQLQHVDLVLDLPLVCVALQVQRAENNCPLLGWILETKWALALRKIASGWGASE